jgi:dTDP-glucose pyrophosphorylase
MNNPKQNLINHSATIIDAMRQMNEESLTLTLFVLNDKDELIGTLTDGDIRRGLVSGKKITDLVSIFMREDFCAINHDYSIYQFREMKKNDIRLLPELDEHNHIVKIHDLHRRKSILPLECIIMAGGRGERLRPLTDTKPKPMLMLGNRPILEHNIDRLIIYGIEKFYISINYLGDQIRDYFGDGSKKGISIEYIEEDRPLGTIGAMSLVDSFGTDHILLMNSDVFTNINYEELYIETIKNKAEMGIASIPYTVSIPFAIFEKEENEIKSIREKPKQTHYANAGIYIFKKEWVSAIPKNSYFDTPELIAEILKSGKKVIENPIVGYWIDIGRLDDYQRAQEIAKHID